MFVQPHEVFQTAAKSLREMHIELLFDEQDKLEDLTGETEELFLQALAQINVARSTLAILAIRTKESL